MKLLSDELIIKIDTLGKGITNPEKFAEEDDTINMCDCTGCDGTCDDDCDLTCDDQCSGNDENDSCLVYFNHKGW